LHHFADILQFSKSTVWDRYAGIYGAFWMLPLKRHASPDPEKIAAGILVLVGAMAALVLV